MEKIKTFNKNENFQLLKSVSSLLVFLEDKLNLKTNVALIPDGIKFTCNTKSEWRSPFGLGIHLVFKLILSEETATVQLCEYNKIYRIVLFFIGVAWLCDEKSAFLGFVLAALSVTGTFMLKRTVRKIFHAFDDNISKEPKECTPQKIEEFANKLSLSGICVLAEKIEKETPGDSFELYKMAAAKKNTRACIKLGDFYYNGEFVTKDLKKAFEYWSACEQNLDADTSLKFADMYRNGEGTEKDLKKAFKFYQNASKENFVQRIVEIYEQGTDLPEYLKAVASIYEERYEEGEKILLDKIIEIYTKLNDADNLQKWQIVKAKNGDIDLALKLGKKLYEDDQKESVELLTMAAKKEDPVALRMLGEAYWGGDLVQEDDEKAIPLLQKAVQKGSLNAAEILTIHYDEYDKDEVKLLNALEQEIALFESGKYVDEDEDFVLADELYELAWLYCSGGEEGKIPRNVSKGIDLFLKAIELGDSDSYLSLAEIYSEEEYGTVDYDKAIAYCKKAVEANVEDADDLLNDLQQIKDAPKQKAEFENLKSCYPKDKTGNLTVKLAQMYAQGKGTEPDRELSLKLLREAYRLGNAEAAYYLGQHEEFYCFNISEAQSLYEFSIEHGFEAAQPGLNLLKQKLKRFYNRLVGPYLDRVERAENDETDINELSLEEWTGYLKYFMHMSLEAAEFYFDKKKKPSEKLPYYSRMHIDYNDNISHLSLAFLEAYHQTKNPEAANHFFKKLLKLDVYWPVFLLFKKIFSEAENENNYEKSFLACMLLDICADHGCIEAVVFRERVAETPGYSEVFDQLKNIVPKQKIENAMRYANVYFFESIF